ncbi:Transcription initiation factor TFIID subunit 12 [Entomophthora muscae]|uniref:Transcription initiation factor TFIID subunit 12 n=2 Tax=Entomophthora muscae TaxID=34485 RepID=A0ACC2S7I0_9FUNG|nr:Transcription initiation factor TFIID subunit 12 [Entomophthora muscae]KAJ9065913.1 Transcription initiation factor TFIID subunit 12 [Entomophthora muscae]
MITKRRLQELVTKIDPSERLDPEAEEILLEIADEFIESVTQSACRLAKHRKSQTLDVKDVQLHLERNWNIRIPGYANDDIRTIRRVTVPNSHINKIAAVNTAKASNSTSSQNDAAQPSQDEPAGEKN